MSEINYQVLREAAEKATKGSYIVGHTSVNQHGNLTGVFVCQKWKGEPGGVIAECHVNCLVETDVQAYANAEFIAAFNPNVALALLDEINALEETRINDVCRIAELTKQLELAKSKLNEQREYYEGVISDGSKRIAELEKSEEQLINERDHAESALADMYFAATGDRPEWSNWFGFSDAVDAVVDRIADLEAKQPAPVVPEEKPMPNPLSMYAVDAVAAIAEVRGWNACRAAMLHGAEPVSQTYKLNELAGNSPVTPDGWISCSERMPPQDDWILIYSKHGEYMAGQVQGEYVELSDGTLSWLGNALFWMPLPEPPQG
ncbi:ead/Ea22-like family protein [Escherichia coli]|nr:ead/Ea22-like family protein [Escherichia coli]MBW3488373.1 ead/Ea22-like family protein [Escherichia coli]